MPPTGFSQLGFDFDDPVAPDISATTLAPASGAHASVFHALAPDASTLSLTSNAVGETTPRPDISWVGGDLTHTAPARGRAAVRARTAVLFSRLQGLGLRSIESLVLMRTRTVMVSLIGRTLRVHEGYADASDDVLQAIVTFATARTRAARTAARTAILSHDVERAPAVRRAERARSGDAALVAGLVSAHRELNEKWFDGGLQPVALRISGRMASRLGHYDPGSRLTPPEIALSRTHVVRHGWREAMHTLLHEMVHQWQHESGMSIDHGAAFRRKCREVGITAAARRTVEPLATGQQRKKAREA